MVRIRRIALDDPLYRQECSLRDEVLLRPLGLTLERFRGEFPGVEEKLEHFVAVIELSGRERVVGCAGLLVEEAAGAGRVMQMAVDLQRQGEGIGRRLLVAIEVRAFGELSLGTLYCHVPVGAVGFYQRLGWTSDSDVFTEASLPHRRMAMHHPYDEEGA